MDRFLWVVVEAGEAVNFDQLKICAALKGAGATDGDVRAEMKRSRIQELTDLTGGALAEALVELEVAGHVTTFHEYGSRPEKNTVWVTLTSTGLQAYNAHADELERGAGTVGV